MSSPSTPRDPASSSRWRQIEEIFLEAVEIPVTDRDAFLTDRCPDPEMRREVDVLLANDESDATGEFRTIIGQMARAAANLTSGGLLAGQRLGPYRLVSLIGRGGMGAVYLAERDDKEFHQRVAIKILRTDAADPVTQSRFRLERQLLAKLDHPYITRLLDGGSSNEGSPYIVMEYVEGTPLIEYARQRQLSKRNRIALFRQICEAVQYAHQQLIVHRDLKPGNILVTGQGVPKLLDFGIAKLLDPGQVTDTAPKTTIGAGWFTPQYASPEQLEGQPVSTSSDIYSLGAVLYELLTGHAARPTTTQDPLEAYRQVMQGEVRPPSEHGDPSFKGDLDTIVMKALQNDRSRRYASADQFSADLERYLEGRPVLARPDTLRYRMAKYVLRHRVGIAALTAILVALVAGYVAQRKQAAIAEERFQQVRSLARSFISFQGDVAKLPGGTTLRARMVATALEYLEKLSRTAGDDAGLLSELSQAYSLIGTAQGYPGEPNLGKPLEAQASYRKAIALMQRAVAIDPKYRDQLAAVYSRTAYLLSLTGAPEEAARLGRNCLEISEELAKQNPGKASSFTQLAAAHVVLGDTYKALGDWKNVMAEYQEGSRCMMEAMRLQPSDGNIVRQTRLALRLAEAHQQLDQLEKSAEQTGQAQVMLNPLLQKRAGDPDYMRLQMMICQQEKRLYGNEPETRLYDPKRSIATVEKYAALAEQLVASDPQNASSRFSRVVAYSFLGHALVDADPGRALRISRQALTWIDEEMRRTPDNVMVVGERANVLRIYGDVLFRQGNREQALKVATEALEMQQASSNENPNAADRKAALQQTRELLAAIQAKGKR